MEDGRCRRLARASKITPNFAWDPNEAPCTYNMFASMGIFQAEKMIKGQWGKDRGPMDAA